MIRFAFLYFTTLVVLFFLFYADGSSISLLTNSFHQKMVLSGLRYLLGQENISGMYLLVSPGFSLHITKACNGIVPFIFYSASIISFPTQIQHKIIWLLVGYFAIMAVNIARIVFVVILLQHSNLSFSIAHDYIGNSMLLFSILTLFVLFAKNR